MDTLLLCISLWYDTLVSLRLPALAAMALKVHNAALGLTIWKVAVAFNRTLKLGKHFPFG